MTKETDKLTTEVEIATLDRQLMKKLKLRSGASLDQIQSEFRAFQAGITQAPNFNSTDFSSELLAGRPRKLILTFPDDNTAKQFIDKMNNKGLIVSSADENLASRYKVARSQLSAPPLSLEAEEKRDDPHP